VSDVTYIRKRDETCDLSLIADAYSKKIKRFYMTDNLNTECIVMAVKNLLNKDFFLIYIVHHYYRGVQYCANEDKKSLLKIRLYEV
jgi:putative transposase